MTKTEQLLLEFLVQEFVRIEYRTYYEVDEAARVATEFQLEALCSKVNHIGTWPIVIFYRNKQYYACPRCGTWIREVN